MDKNSVETHLGHAQFALAWKLWSEVWWSCSSRARTRPRTVACWCARLVCPTALVGLEIEAAGGAGHRPRAVVLGCMSPNCWQQNTAASLWLSPRTAVQRRTAAAPVAPAPRGLPRRVAKQARWCESAMVTQASLLLESREIFRKIRTHQTTTKAGHWQVAFEPTKNIAKSPFRNSLNSGSYLRYSCESCSCSIEHNFQKTGDLKPGQTRNRPFSAQSSYLSHISAHPDRPGVYSNAPLSVAELGKWKWVKVFGKIVTSALNFSLTRGCDTQGRLLWIALGKKRQNSAREPGTSRRRSAPPPFPSW